MAPERAVTVFGAGAVGGYLGALLAVSPDHPRVTLIGRPPVVEAVRARGLVVQEGGQELRADVRAVTTAEEAEPADLVLFTVRTFDVSRNLDALGRLTAPGGLVAAFQNGVGTEVEVRDALGGDRVLACTLTVSAGMTAPGVITRFSRRGGIAVAGMSGRPVPAWVMSLLASTGLPTIELADYRTLRWSKLLLNMLGAATSAILDVDLAMLAASPSLFRAEQLAFREATRVMAAAGISTASLPGYPVPAARAAMRLPRPLAQTILAPRLIAARSGRSPSARGDMERGRSEIGAFNGAIAEAGTRLGVRTPVNSALAEITARLADKPEDRAHFRGQPDVLVAELQARGIRL